MRRWLLVQLYRIQSAQALLAPLLWALALSGIFWPVARPVWLNLGLRSEDVALGIALTFAVVLAGIFTLGFLYDVILRLWRDQHRILVARNPYANRSLTSKERLLLMHATVPMMRALALERGDERLMEHIQFLERWLEENE